MSTVFWIFVAAYGLLALFLLRPMSSKRRRELDALHEDAMDAVRDRARLREMRKRNE